jgi:hypothetical protein
MVPMLLRDAARRREEERYEAQTWSLRSTQRPAAAPPSPLENLVTCSVQTDAIIYSSFEMQN